MIIPSSDSSLYFIMQRSKSDRLLSGQNWRRSDTRFSKAAIGAILTKRQLCPFETTGSCAAVFDILVKGRSEPFVSIDTKDRKTLSAEVT
jgi:hypothetical protein